MKRAKDCIQIAMDNKLQHTWLVIVLVDLTPMSDRPKDSEIAVACVVMMEMRWASREEQMDIFLELNDDGVNDEGDSR